jgi:hypothetical protein
MKNPKYSSKVTKTTTFNGKLKIIITQSSKGVLK